MSILSQSRLTEAELHESPKTHLQRCK